jgi:hypothetical protein
MEATREEVVKYLMGNRKSLSDSQKNLTVEYIYDTIEEDK